MRAVMVRAHGGPEVLRVEEVAVPEVGRGQALVRVEAAGVNFIDVYHRTGLYAATLPFTPGQEACGVVEAVGPDVVEVRPGDRVAYATRRGSYAEYALVPARVLVPVPAGVSSELAAAVMLQGMTAHYLSHDTYPLREGDVALVHAAAGGVGLLLVQLAKMRGATVLGTVSTEEKARLAREAGADELILYTQEDFTARVRALTGGGGADVVYDSVGQATFDGSLSSLRPRGYMVSFGQSSGPVPPVDPLKLSSHGSLYLTRARLADYVAERSELLRRASDLFGWIERGELKVRIDRVLPLEEAAEAHRLLEGRATSGKLLLKPGPG